MKRGRASGWQLRNRQVPFQVVPVVPAEWDGLLRSLSMTEEMVIPELRLVTVRSLAVREWVVRHHHHKYAPCAVLNVLGYRED